VYELNVTAARLAREAAEEFSTGARPRFVIGSMGPTTKSITVVGGVTFAQLVEVYYERAKACSTAAPTLSLPKLAMTRAR